MAWTDKHTWTEHLHKQSTCLDPASFRALVQFLEAAATICLTKHHEEHGPIVSYEHAAVSRKQQSCGSKLHSRLPLSRRCLAIPQSAQQLASPGQLGRRVPRRQLVPLSLSAIQRHLANNRSTSRPAAHTNATTCKKVLSCYPCRRATQCAEHRATGRANGRLKSQVVTPTRSVTSRTPTSVLAESALTLWRSAKQCVNPK